MVASFLVWHSSHIHASGVQLAHTMDWRRLTHPLDHWPPVLYHLHPHLHLPPLPTCIARMQQRLHPRLSLAARDFGNQPTSLHQHHKLVVEVTQLPNLLSWPLHLHSRACLKLQCWPLNLTRVPLWPRPPRYGLQAAGILNTPHAL